MFASCTQSANEVFMSEPLNWRAMHSAEGVLILNVCNSSGDLPSVL